MARGRRSKSDNMTKSRSRDIVRKLTGVTGPPEFQDFEYFAEKYLRIMNRPESSSGKDPSDRGRMGMVVPFKLNFVQKDLLARIEAAKAAGKPGRFVILKARRMGLSTLAEGIIGHRCMTQTDRKARIIAHDEDSTDTIFSMLKTFWERMPDGKSEGEEDLRPAARRNNDRRLWLTHPLDESAGLNSEIRVSPALSRDAARSTEIHYFHGSEVAFWPDAKSLMGGLMPILSDDPETLVLMESTANGVGGWFYDKFWEAYNKTDKQGRPIDTDWEAVFYPWHFMPNYQTPIPSELSWEEACRRFDGTLKQMILKYDLSPEQAWWAYKTWQDKLGRDWTWFKQEFPSNPEEAFAFSGRKAFDTDHLSAIQQKYVKNPYFVGDIFDAAEMPEAARINYASTMEPDIRLDEGVELPPLWIWEMPKEGVEYIVATDPSAGMTAGDYTAIQVVEAQTRRQVAEWVGTAKPWPTAERAILLAVYYNEALLSWEIEGPGRAVSDAVDHSEYWRVVERVDPNTIAVERKWGWSTNRATKPRMVESGRSVIDNELQGCIRSERLMVQAQEYKEWYKEPVRRDMVDEGETKAGRVKYGAPPGNHDDAVMAWLQALIVADQEFGVARRPSDIEKERDLRPELSRVRWSDDDFAKKWYEGGTEL